MASQHTRDTIKGISTRHIILNLMVVLSMIALAGCNTADADTESNASPTPTVDIAATEEAREESVLVALESFAPKELQEVLNSTCIDSELLPIFIECQFIESGKTSGGLDYANINLDWSNLERDETMAIQGIKVRASDSWEIQLTYYLYPTRRAASQRLQEIEDQSLRTFSSFPFSGKYTGIISDPRGFGLADTEGIAAMQVGNVLVYGYAYYINEGHPDGPMHSPNDLPRRLVRAAVTHLEIAMEEAAPESRSTPESTGSVQVGEEVDFTLTNYDGESMSMSDFSGKVVVLFFGYTHCPDFCPMTLTDFQRVKEILGPNTDDVAFVMVSIDPKRDTPERMKNYLSFFDDEFVGLTGSEAELLPVKQMFGVTATLQEGTADSNEHYLVDHTDNVFILDSAGRLAFDYVFATPEEISEDVRDLLDS